MPVGVPDAESVVVSAGVMVAGRVRVGDAVRNGVSLGTMVGATVGVTCGTARLQAGSSHASSASQ